MEDEDLDGIPLNLNESKDEDIDGVPISLKESKESKESNKSLGLPPSRWDEDDDDDIDGKEEKIGLMNEHPFYFFALSLLVLQTDFIVGLTNMTSGNFILKCYKKVIFEDI